MPQFLGRGARTYEEEMARRRRDRRAALQRSQPNQTATGFTATEPQGITAAPTATRLGDYARYANAARGIGLSNRQIQGTMNRRYGQQQGMGRGYQYPRRAIGGFQQGYGGPRQGYNRLGYAPRTAAMYGGRPSYGQPRGEMIYNQQPGYGYRMNQAQAMTRPQYSYGAQVRQPWGGYNAVRRYNPYQQTRRGW